MGCESVFSESVTSCFKSFFFKYKFVDLKLLRYLCKGDLSICRFLHLYDRTNTIKRIFKCILTLPFQS